MKNLFFAFILLFSLAAHSAVLNESITSVELSKGINFSSIEAKTFSTMDEAQKFANANHLNEITLRINMHLNEASCNFNLPAISLGYIYDQDRAIFNGQLIGSTGNPELSKRRLSLVPRVYPIPLQSLKCPGENRLDLSLKRILGGWIGPFSGSIELGELHELQQKAMVTEAWGPLFQRDIGILLLAISILLISLFYRYTENYRQSAFVIFSFSASLLCLSLSGWYYRYFDYPDIIFRLHFAFVSLALITQALFVAAYRGINFAKTVSRPLFFFGSFFVFAAISFSVSSVTTLLNIYLFQLLVLILVSLTIYLLPVIWPKKFKVGCEFNYGIEASLFLIHLGASMDIARIWKLHSFENVSPYTYGLSVFIIGSILASELVRVFQRAAQTAEAESELQQSQKQTEFARQLGHDIRSPLAALNMMVTCLDGVPEDQRIVIRNSAQRINDIANSLVHRRWSSLSESMGSGDGALQNTKQVLMLSSFVDSIVSEKRVQYRERYNVSIEIDLSESYGLFSKINSRDLARALSNLIDNSVEALAESHGRILIAIESDTEFNRIVVTDNASGMSKEVMAKIGSQGASFGKRSGSGLGLHHARQTAESAGGKLLIDSQISKGTTVVIVLPKALPPTWFISHLSISSDTKIISIDDDQTVHQIWENRLRHFKGPKPQHFAFTTISQFEDWYAANDNERSKFLVDFEFLGHSETGLQLIERLKIASRAVLVSSRAEDSSIQDRANALGLKVLPKALAALVPIEVIPASL